MVKPDENHNGTCTINDPPGMNDDTRLKNGLIQALKFVPV